MRYLDGCMTQSQLAGFLDLTSSAASGKGSYALSADQSGLFLASRHATAKEIAGTINRYVIAPLVRVNYGPSAAVPKLVFEKISEDQTDRALALLQQLGTSPNLQVPVAFINLLIERTAQYLDLPDDRVEKILREQPPRPRMRHRHQRGAPRVVCRMRSMEH
jgi:phage gp29-like protein